MLNTKTLQDILEEWHPQLRTRTGSPTRLMGLRVWYDFSWRALFDHNRAAFRNGQDLARTVRNGCPPGKTPCLLLTTKDDMEDGPLYTNDDNYVFVMRIHRYLEEARAGAAATYLLTKFGVSNMVTARQIRKAASDPHQQDEILEVLLADREGLIRWTGREPATRAPMLHEIASAHVGMREDSPFARGTAINWIRSAGASAIREVVDEVASTKEGRRAMAMADPTSGRAEDLREAAMGYRELLESESPSETDFQDYIMKNPMLLGLEYAEVRSRQKLRLGELDFVARRHDGYHDLLELKGPEAEIIHFRGGPEKRPSSYSLAPKLAQALAQVQLHREWIATSSQAEREYYEVTRDPRITIVIGRDSALPNETARQILRQLNVTLHRTTVSTLRQTGRSGGCAAEQLGHVPVSEGISTAESSKRVGLALLGELSARVRGEHRPAFSRSAAAFSGSLGVGWLPCRATITRNVSRFRSCLPKNASCGASALRSTLATILERRCHCHTSYLPAGAA